LERDSFAVDRSKASGRSRCRRCDSERAKGYYAAHREELLAKLRARREAARPPRLTRREEQELVHRWGVELRASLARRGEA
jgi:hypothetical protein